MAYINSSHKSKSAFTLIELSIVLVIIGLIVGGVLVGRDLIKSAEIRKMGTTLLSYELAINTFKGKYNNLPGDFATASSVLTGANNGNGSGVIGDAESGLFVWQHLALAGLIPGRYTGAVSVLYAGGGPISVIDENIPPFVTDNAGCSFHWFASEDWGPAGYFFHPRQTVIYCGSGLSNGWHVNNFITGPNAKALDSKFDDGKIGTGKIRGSIHNSTTAVNDPTADYSPSNAMGILLYLPGLY